MFRNLSQAYHYYREAGLSPSESMEGAKRVMASNLAQSEQHQKRMRQKSERKYAPYEMDELRRQYSGEGKHFFDPGSMRFFNSRIKDRVYGGNMFITSERGPSGPRAYTIKKIDKQGRINTVGEFQQYATSAAAERAITRIMKQTKARKHSR